MWPNPDSNGNCDSNANSDRDAHRNSNSYANCNSDRYANCDSDRYANSHTNSGPNGYTNPDPDPNADGLHANHYTEWRHVYWSCDGAALMRYVRRNDLLHHGRCNPDHELDRLHEPLHADRKPHL